MAKHIPEEKLNKADGGFSLLEVIISMAILALVTIPLLNYFTDSLRTSARMAQRQRGTLAAQELTEALKAVDKLIVVPDDSDDYTVPYLLKLFGDSLVQTGSFGDDGKGEVTFAGILEEWTCSSCGYVYKGFSAPDACPACNQNLGFSNADSDHLYARVTISTSVAANAVSRPLVYGIDDSTDLLALERNQVTEAIVYFTSVNTVYCSEHPSETPLTQDQLTAKLNRTIHVDVDHDGTNFLVKVYYEYKCSGLRGRDTNGNLIEDSYTGSYLVDSKIKTLKNLYLLYTCSDVEDNIILNIPTGVYDMMESFDEENIRANSAEPVKNSTYMGLYLIAQGLKNDALYTLNITGYEDVFHTSIHTNVVSAKHSVWNVDKGSNIDPVFLMTSSGTPTRLIKITAEIFENEQDVPDDSLAVVETTKGE